MRLSIRTQSLLTRSDSISCNHRGFISPTLDLSVLQKVDPPACAIAVCHGEPLRRQSLFVNDSNPQDLEIFVTFTTRVVSISFFGVHNDVIHTGHLGIYVVN